MSDDGPVCRTESGRQVLLRSFFLKRKTLRATTPKENEVKRTQKKRTVNKGWTFAGRC